MGKGILFGGILAAAFVAAGAYLIPKALASSGSVGNDEGNDNPVTSTGLSISPNPFTDGQSVGFFWNITGGSGRFTGRLILPGGDIKLSEEEFALGQIYHVFDLGNLTTQDRFAILQITDIETGVLYNRSAAFTINPKDDIPGTTDYPIVQSLAGPFQITSNNELVVKINYENISDKDTGPVIAYFQVTNPKDITKWLSTSPIGNIKPKAKTTLEYRTGSLATFSAGFEWTAEFFTWTADRIILSNVLPVGFYLPRENNP